MADQPPAVSSSLPTVATVARQYRGLWRDVRTICRWPAVGAIDVLVIMVIELVTGSFSSDVNARHEFISGGSTVYWLWFFTNPIVLALVGAYRWALVSALVAVAGTAVLLATNSLIYLDYAQVLSSIFNRDGRSHQIYDHVSVPSTLYAFFSIFWLLWAVAAIVSSLAAVGRASVIAVTRLGDDEPRAPRIFSQFAQCIKKRRQTFRSYNLGKVYLLFLAALASAASTYGIYWCAQLLGNIWLNYASNGVWRTVSTSSMQATSQFVAANLPAVLLDWAGIIASWVLTVYMAVLVFRAAWRYVRRSADEVMQDPRYRPTVFLRSFRDEDAHLTPKNALYRLLRRQVRLEEVIVGLLTRLGPAVAIGVPGERIPRLGALRSYYTGDDWQGAVRQWVDRSYFVVVLAGSTPSALWELKYLAEQRLIQRVILILPPDAMPAARTARWAAICQCLADTPWTAALQALACQHLMCVAFEPGGRVIGVAGGPAHQVDYEIALQYAVTKAAVWNPV